MLLTVAPGGRPGRISASRSTVQHMGTAFRARRGDALGCIPAPAPSPRPSAAGRRSAFLPIRAAAVVELRRNERRASRWRCTPSGANDVASPSVAVFWTQSSSR